MSDSYGPRWRGILDGRPMPKGPFTADVHSFDINHTIAACIHNASPLCAAIVLVDRGGPLMRAAACCAAEARGMQIFWEDRVRDTDLIDQGMR